MSRPRTPAASISYVVILIFIVMQCAGSVAQTRPRAAAAPMAGNPESRAARYMESVRHDPVKLRAFLRAFPKGGDLHNHLSGAIYAENYIQWAAEIDLCVDTQTLTLLPPKKDAAKGPTKAAEKTEA